MKRKGVDQLAFNKALTNLQDRKVTAIFAVGPMPTSFMDRTRFRGNRPNIQQDHRQGQTTEAIIMLQHGALQIKAMRFQVAKHFFDPHSATISLECERSIRQVCDQTPGLVFANGLMHQQIHLINFALSQPTPVQPAALARFLHPTTKVMPIRFLRQTHKHRGFLSQNLVPTPLVQLTQHFHRPKIAIAHQKHSKTFRQQAAHISQQRQLGHSGTMSAYMRDSRPGNRDGASPVRQADDQQLMRKVHFTSIYNQPDMLPVLGLTFQPLSRNRFIPHPHANRRIGQQAAQVARDTDQFGGLP